MSGVDLVPIETVIEAESSCADRARAEAILSASLASARGPRRTHDDAARWHLRMSVTPGAAGTKAASARMTDDGGRIVADRAVTDKTAGSCVALARAVGAWAQIVLDDEVVREQSEADRREREAPPPPPQTHEPAFPASAVQRPVDADDVTASEPRTSSTRTVDVGTMLFLRNGAARAGGMFGVSPFVAIGFGERWVLRPSVMYATSTSKVPPDQSNSAPFNSIGGRLDLCGRVPGNYINHRGIELDLCMGGDAIHVWSRHGSVDRGSVGPSGTLRGELGGNVGVEFRTMVGLALNTRPISNEGPAPPFVTAFELGGSMRFE